MPSPLGHRGALPGSWLPVQDPPPSTLPAPDVCSSILLCWLLYLGPILDTPGPGPVGSWGFPSSSAAQVPAAPGGDGGGSRAVGGSRPACASPGLDPGPQNTEPNFTLPLEVSGPKLPPGSLPRSGESRLCPRWGSQGDRVPGSRIFVLAFWFKGMVLALGEFSDPVCFRWGKPGRLRSPLQEEELHQVSPF